MCNNMHTQIGLVRFDGCAKLVEVEIVVVGLDQWCWFNFFGSQVVGRSRFFGSRSARSIMGLKRG